MEKVCFNGGLRSKNKRGISLTVYSTPFARFLLKNHIRKINLLFKDESFTIKKGKERDVVIERLNRNQPLCVFAVTKIIPLSLKKRLTASGKQMRVKVLVENIVSDGELREYNNAINSILPTKNITPIKESERIDVGCFITCFRSKNSSFYRFSARHRIIEEIVNKNERIILGRDKKGNFILGKSNKGKCFNLYKSSKGRSVAYMQISPDFITDTEKGVFKKGRRCISYRAFLSKKEFDLDISKFFSAREERELAYALIKRGINIRIPKMREREGDIILRDSGTQIEITNILPRNDATKNNPHSGGIHINGRLCEGFLRVKRTECPLFFVVFNKKWMTRKWVENLAHQVKPEVVAIATDFKNGWAEDVSCKIMNATNRVL